MQLNLDQQEAGVLRLVLEAYLPQLREEVYKTEAYELREGLKQREEVVKRLLSSLQSASPA